MEMFVVGIWLLLGATGILVLVVFLTRWIAQSKAEARFARAAAPVIPDLPQTQEAVLLVQRGGGRVLYTNQPARDWFGYQTETPNLERLARRTLPADVFLSLCALEGQARLTIDGRLVGSTPEYAEVTRLSIDRGHFITDAEAGRDVLIRWGFPGRGAIAGPHPAPSPRHRRRQCRAAGGSA